MMKSKPHDSPYCKCAACTEWLKPAEMPKRFTSQQMARILRLKVEEVTLTDDEQAEALALAEHEASKRDD